MAVDIIVAVRGTVLRRIASKGGRDAQPRSDMGAEMRGIVHLASCIFTALVKVSHTQMLSGAKRVIQMCRMGQVEKYEVLSISLSFNTFG